MSKMNTILTANKHCITKWKKEIESHATTQLLEYRINAICKIVNI